MRALLFVAVVGLAAGAPIVPEGAAAAVPPAQSYSIWALAKRFFTAEKSLGFPIFAQRFIFFSNQPLELL